MDRRELLLLPHTITIAGGFFFIGLIFVVQGTLAGLLLMAAAAALGVAIYRERTRSE